MSRKRPDYETCGNCTHTENIHEERCEAYLCRCREFTKKSKDDK